MVDIKTAVQWLIERHKIHRPSWNKSSYLVLRGNDVVNDKGEPVKWSNINSLSAIDWLVYKEDEFTNEERERTRLLVSNLSEAFEWDKTNQGRAYWDEVWENLKEIAGGELV